MILKEYMQVLARARERGDGEECGLEEEEDPIIIEEDNRYFQ